MKKISLENFASVAASLRRPYHESYLAMYSSVLGGITVDPVLMTVPIDDHMVHRGDGVFEAMRCVNGALYNLGAHLDRLERSAKGICLELPVCRGDLTELLAETVRAGEERDAVVRLFVSRGPGSFGANPYHSPQAQLYIVVTRAAHPFMEDHPAGARLRTSTIPAKDPSLAAIKNCNYLPNVLMVKESVDLGVDFVVSLDAHGFLAEGPTENVGIVTPGKELAFPRLDGVLRGTTMMRLVVLAEELVRDGHLREVNFRDITRDDALNASEIVIVGTTRDVTSVREYDGQAIGSGGPGPVAGRLGERLCADMLREPSMRTSVFGEDGQGRHDT